MRVSTGIPGLDELIGGGIPAGKTVLVSGKTGTGKTILSVQFLVNGIGKGENGVLVTIGEDKGRIMEYMKNFGWDLEEMCKDGSLSVLDLTPVPKGGESKFYLAHDPEIEFTIDSLASMIDGEVRRIGAKRMAIDSVSGILLAYSDEFSLRYEMLALLNMMRNTGCTAILTSELTDLPRERMIEFLVDGVIELDYPLIGNERIRTLAIRKMRGTPHDLGVYMYEIGRNGISIVSKAEYLR